jgi:hypothetical protein
MATVAELGTYGAVLLLLGVDEAREAIASNTRARRVPHSEEDVI